MFAKTIPEKSGNLKVWVRILKYCGIEIYQEGFNLTPHWLVLQMVI